MVYLLKNVIFHGYVSLPEGIVLTTENDDQPWDFGGAPGQAI